MNDIVFCAAVYKIQTLADGGIRLGLDLPESAILQVAQLMECKRQGFVGEVTYRPVAAEMTPNADGIRSASDIL